jgi:MYXO-CTERM domain-containing protein
VAWEENVTFPGAGTFAIVGSRIDDAGMPLDAPDGVAISTRTSQQYPCAAVRGAAQFLVAWVDDRGGPAQRASRVNDDASVSVPGGFLLTDSTEPSWCSRLAFDGGSYLAVFSEELAAGTTAPYELYARRVATDGVLEPGELVLASASTDHFLPAVATDGDGFVVVYRDLIEDLWSVRAARVGGDGVVTTPPGGLEIHPFEVDEVAIFGAATGYLAAMSDPAGVHVLPLASDGSPAGAVVTVAAETLAGDPRVTSDGTSFLVVWTRDDEIRAIHVASDGTPLDPAPLSVGSSTMAYWGTEVAFDGSAYLIAWDSDLDEAARHLMVRRVPTTGPPLLGEVEVVAPIYGSVGGLACDTVTHSCIVTYWRFDPSLRRVRTKGRFVYASGPGAGNPLGAGCLADVECATGYCVDDVCCPSACDGVCDACSVEAGGTTDGSCDILTCPPPDECHVAGTCEFPSGNCVPPAVPDGTPCSGGSCSGGACVVIDAGPTPMADAMAPDAPTGADAQTGSDATASSDGATAPQPGDGGCGCRTSPATPASWVTLLPILAVLRRRRRAPG